MRALFRLNDSARSHLSVTRWFDDHQGPLGEIASFWFRTIKQCGNDVEEVLHDGHPTSCVEGAAFAYVNVFTSHVNVGFFHATDLSDPKGLLEGTGKYMRHVKIQAGIEVDVEAMTALVQAAYADVKARLVMEDSSESPHNK